MLQRDRKFGTNHNFIFVLFNQFLRHQASRKISIAFKNNPESIRAIADIVEADDFQRSIDIAFKNNDGDESKLLLKKFLPHIRATSSSLPFSASERKSCLSKLIAYIRHFGNPSYFITVSPNDLGSRLILTLSDGREVPIKDAQQRIPAIVASDPVVTAEVFYRTMNKMMQTLIGILNFNQRFDT